MKKIKNFFDILVKTETLAHFIKNQIFLSLPKQKFLKDILYSPKTEISKIFLYFPQTEISSVTLYL